ncbi:MAG: DNA cytosine methyltransferase [Bacteroidota bacterium]|nr:DNA cytosine methyltransferase [Bacteroidota bacterium]
MTHASLFSGIGGFDLASEWAGWTNLFNCEIDPFCKTVLKYHFQDAIQYDNIKQTDFTLWRGRVDVLTGGFPCQPFSLAGKRKGTEDERHLWPEMLRAIREISPCWVVGENVFGIINWSKGMVFEQVQADLEAAGYEVQPFVLPACAVNAPHRRDRVWFVARRIDVEYTNSSGFQKKRTEQQATRFIEHRELDWNDTYNPNTRLESLQQERKNGIYEFKYAPYATSKRSEERQQNERYTNTEKNSAGLELRSERSGFNGNASHTMHYGLQRCIYSGEDRTERWENENGYIEKRLCNIRRNKLQFDNFPTQSTVCGRNDGISYGLDGITFSKWRNESIKAYGNAVVPIVPLQIFEAINEFESITK